MKYAYTALIPILMLLVLFSAGCHFDTIVEEMPEIQTYVDGWDAGWIWCHDNQVDQYPTAEQTEAFQTQFGIFSNSRDALDQSDLSEYQQGAWDAFRFYVRNYKGD